MHIRRLFESKSDQNPITRREIRRLSATIALSAVIALILSILNIRGQLGPVQAATIDNLFFICRSIVIRVFQQRHLALR